MASPSRASWRTAAVTPGLVGAALSGQSIRSAAADSLRVGVERRRDSLPVSRFGPRRAETTEVFDDAFLGLADALDGNYAAARERMDGILRVYGLNVDAMQGYRGIFAAAVIEILAGEPDAAIEYLEPLLAQPPPISVAFLETVPLFDSLRDEPEFQRLLEQYR